MNFSKEPLSLTEGDLRRDILRFSAPLMFSNVLQVLFNMSDVAVVGRFAGASALGSVGSTTLFISVFSGFLIGIGSGVNALTARCLGARQYKDVKECVNSSLVFALGAAVLLMLLCILSCRPLLTLMGTKDELIEGSLLYVRICALGMPAMGLYNFGSGVLSAAGDTKKPLVILTLSGILNVILNLIFVILMKLGVAGVALATIVSQYLSAILVMVLVVRSSDSLKLGLDFKDFCVNAEKIRAVALLGMSAGFQNAIFSIANLFIQAAVNRFPAVIVEGNSAAANADTLVYTMMAAFYVACTSFMAQNWGAGNKERVIRSFRISTAYSFAVGLVMGVLLVLFSGPFLSLFTTDPEVIEAGRIRVLIMGLSYCISSPMDNTIAASRGLGKTAVPTVIVIMGSCVFRVAWIYTVFEYFQTIPSIYLLYCFSWTLTAAAELFYFFRIYKKTFPEEV